MVSTCVDHELTESQARAIVRLVNLAWPSPKPEDERVAEFMRVAVERASKPKPPDGVRVVVWQGEELIANAKSFGRTILTERGPLKVLALGVVCVAPEHRGKGWGKAVAQTALKRVDDGEFPVSLFQTSVPDFYVPFGARLVDNRFVDDPWMDPYAMIYPGSFDWPAGPIDINGPGW